MRLARAVGLRSPHRRTRRGRFILGVGWYEAVGDVGIAGLSEPRGRPCRAGGRPHRRPRLPRPARARGAPARPPGTVADPPDDLPEVVRSRLAARGLTALWSHQAAAADLAHAGRNVVVATGTASGKSSGLPAAGADAAARADGHRGRRSTSPPPRRWPRDQLRARPLRSRSPGSGRPPTTATPPPSERRLDPRARRLRPDQPRHAAPLHPARPRALGALPARLRYVVIDECHPYRGRLRLPRRPRAAPAAAGLRPLRRQPDVRARLGHRRRTRPSWPPG